MTLEGWIGYVTGAFYTAIFLILILVVYNRLASRIHQVQQSLLDWRRKEKAEKEEKGKLKDM